jgi:hypothetical protein
MNRLFIFALSFLVLASQTAKAQNSSVFTTLDLDDCAGSVTIIDEETEEGYWSGVCEGLDGITVFATEGDLRFDVDFGVENDRFETAPFFNEPHSTIEWRLDASGKPFAVIHRFWSSGFSEGTSMLAVSKIGTPGEPGCMVGLFRGDVPDVNARATALADAVVDRLDCAELVTFLNLY